MTKLRGAVRLETAEMILWADEVDYDEKTHYFEARGSVHFKDFERKAELWANKVEYYINEQKGTFYEVIGETSLRIETRPGILTSTSPFHFEGKWAERVGGRYVLYQGMITNCQIPRPWWTLRGPKFDIIPNDRAIAYKSVFRVRKFPIFYAPYFYKSLAKIPRRSGFLTPSVGNSSTLGKMIGIGYFWAINRSYDTTYYLQDFTDRGLAHHVEFRGKPRPGTDFDAILFGVQDRGYKAPGTFVSQPDGTQSLLCPGGYEVSGGDCRLKQGGLSLTAEGRSDLGHGFIARGSLNYLSSLQFRQAFTQTYREAIDTELHSVGSISKHWSTYDLDLVASRTDNFQSTAPGDSIVLRKLPEVEFRSRDKQISEKVLPVWISFDSSIGLLRRSQPTFETRQFNHRADFEPRITTALYWKGFSLIPSFSVRGTHYGSQREMGEVLGKNIFRGSREVYADLIFPSLARVFNKKTIFGDQLKHVIEPRASFRSVGGIDDFQKYIRFDETELLSNTAEVEISLTNRFYAKRNGQASEVLSWELWQRRYFEPSFGGAIVDGQRNVLLSSIEVTPYAFLDRARRYSPIVSAVRASPMPGTGIEWRTDFDPLRKQVVNSSVSVDARSGNLFLSIGHILVHSDPDHLSPSTNQFRGALIYGNPNHRGWNLAFTPVYDFRLGSMQFATTQVTYNTNCCGLSFQYQRINVTVPPRNDFRVAFSVANIGTFGTLKKQERIF